VPKRCEVKKGWDRRRLIYAKGTKGRGEVSKTKWDKVQHGLEHLSRRKKIGGKRAAERGIGKHLAVGGDTPKARLPEQGGK